MNALTADDKYSLFSRDDLMLPIQMDLSQKEKTFFRLFCTFFKSTLNFEQFRKKMTLITYVSPNLGTPIDVVR